MLLGFFVCINIIKFVIMRRDKKMNSKDSLLHDNIYKLFGKFLITSVAGMLAVSFYILVDTIFVGRGVGSDGLAALNIAIPVITLLTATGLLVGIGGATALSVSRGQGEFKKLNVIFTHSFGIAVLIGILYSAMGIIFLEKLSFMLGASEGNIHLVKGYLKGILFFGFSFVLVSTFTVFIRNDKAPKFAMWTTITGGLLNVVLDALFIFVFKWGMFGAAFATSLSSLTSLSLIFYYFKKSSTILRLKKIKIDFSIIKRIFTNGFPSFVIEISSGIVIFAFNIALLNTIGEIGVSAYSIIANISLICVSIFTGIAQGVQPIASINYGADLKDRVSKVRNMGLVTALVLGIIFFILGNMFPKQIVSLFIQNNRILEDITVNAIKLYFTAFIIMGANIIIGAYFQSIEEASISTVISIGRGVGFILIGLIALPYFFSINGIWLTVPFAELCTLIMCLIICYFRHKFAGSSR